MGYRPITDMWMLTRPKLRGGVRYYGAYLGDFPERSRVLLGASIYEPSTQPDFLQDARNPLPLNDGKSWRAVLIDPPYSPDDAAHYELGADVYPSPYELVTNALRVVDIGGKVGIIHYSLPKKPKNTKFIACVGIVCGFGNRIRVFSVFERLS